MSESMDAGRTAASDRRDPAPDDLFMPIIGIALCVVVIVVAVVGAILMRRRRRP